MFASPFVTESQPTFNAVMRQAIGRVHRYGQQKEVHIYHFLSAGSLDVNIVQERTGKVMVRRKGEFYLVPKEKVRPTDVERFSGAGTGVERHQRNEE